MQLVQPTDFNSRDFVVGNDITINRTPLRYPLSWGVGRVGAHEDHEDRRSLFVTKDGLGYIHLDFRVSTNGVLVIARIPDNAPTPISLIEVQVGGGSVWVERGSREIKSYQVSRNTRHIINIPGIFA